MALAASLISENKYNDFLNRLFNVSEVSVEAEVDGLKYEDVTLKIGDEEYRASPTAALLMAGANPNGEVEVSSELTEDELQSDFPEELPESEHWMDLSVNEPGDGPEKIDNRVHCTLEGYNYLSAQGPNVGLEYVNDDSSENFFVPVNNNSTRIGAKQFMVDMKSRLENDDIDWRPDLQPERVMAYGDEDASPESISRLDWSAVSMAMLDQGGVTPEFHYSASEGVSADIGGERVSVPLEVLMSATPWMVDELTTDKPYKGIPNIQEKSANGGPQMPATGPQQRDPRRGMH